MTGTETAKGCVDFFEPEAFVEAQKGLLEKVGLGELRKSNRTDRRLFSLDELLTYQDYSNRAELQIGLGVTDVLRHVYEREQRFTLRDRRPAYLVEPQGGTGLAEVLFGSYPSDGPSAYIRLA